MRMEVVNRIESVIKELWPSADVSACRGTGGVGGHPGPQVESVRRGSLQSFRAAVHLPRYGAMEV